MSLPTFVGQLIRKVEELKDQKRGLSMSTKEHKEEYESIKKYAESKNIQISASDRKKMDEYIGFWAGRAAADRTMFDAASKIADTPGKTIVAMNIGSLHTGPQIDLCKKEDRPFVVITPLAKINDLTQSDLSTPMYERKLKQRSVFANGVSLVIEEAVGGKKPGPVLSQHWFQAKSEVYTFVDRVAMKALESSNSTSPFGLLESGLTGRWISIDPKRLSLIPASSTSKERKAILIPIVFKETGTTVWVKAGLVQGSIETGRTVESILRRALADVEREAATPEKAEDESGRVQVSINVLAGFAQSMEGAQKIELTGA